MRKLVILLSLLASVVWGQRTDTVYQTIMTNANFNDYSVTVRNIGQSIHNAFVQSYDKSPGSCNHYFGATFQGSYDGTNWFNFPTRVRNADVILIVGGSPNPHYNSNRLFEARGAFPYIRFVINTGATGVDTNCKFSAWYTGVLYTSAMSDILTAFGSYGGLYSVSNEISSSGNNDVGTVVNNPLTVAVYSAIICTDGTAGQTVTLKEKSPSATYIQLQPLYGFCPCMILPYTGIPYFVLASGYDLALTLGLSANVSYTFEYRTE